MLCQRAMPIKVICQQKIAWYATARLLGVKNGKKIGIQLNIAAINVEEQKQPPQPLNRSRKRKEFENE